MTALRAPFKVQRFKVFGIGTFIAKRTKTMSEL
jgi:hypothetical protein